MKTALVVGATGLIGGQLLDLLLVDDNYERVIAISRRPLLIQNSKLQNVIADLVALDQVREALVADDVFCCLGTIMKIAKTKEAFRKVDFEYPLAIAQITRRSGSRQFLLVSALGAKSSSSIFYNRVKGETEEAVARVGFESLHIFQPSLLFGPRKEVRSGEDTVKSVYKAIGFLIPRKYKAIESIKVARAMIALAKEEKKGVFVHESRELQSF